MPNEKERLIGKLCETSKPHNVDGEFFDSLPTLTDHQSLILMKKLIFENRRLIDKIPGSAPISQVYALIAGLRRLLFEGRVAFREQGGMTFCNPIGPVPDSAQEATFSLWNEKCEGLTVQALSELTERPGSMPRA